MEYWIREVQEGRSVERTASVKARYDVEAIFERKGLKAVDIDSKEAERKNGNLLSRLGWHFLVFSKWNKALSFLKDGDTLYIQFPIREHSFLQALCIRKLTKRGIKVILLIHDLEVLRLGKKRNISLLKRLRLTLEERKCLAYASVIIAHNHKMKHYVHNLGIDERKIISLQLFDYLTDIPMKPKDDSHKSEVIIAGNLNPDKAVYIYNLPSECRFNLYGIGFDDDCKDKNITYHGSYEPEELLDELAGGFGLVWDGTSVETCSGTYGDYLRINNPHKASLYLAAGFPVIIWSEAALADFITEHNCGILVDSLYDLQKALYDISAEEYQKMVDSAMRIGSQLRKGYYLSSVIDCIRRGEYR